MRRKQRLVQTIRVAPRTTITNEWETLEGWGVPVEIRAAVLPLGDGISAEMYGERATSMRRIIADRPDGLEKNSGVWLPGETGESPPWTIASVETWPNHTEVTLEARDG